MLLYSNLPEIPHPLVLDIWKLQIFTTDAKIMFLIKLCLLIRLKK